MESLVMITSILLLISGTDLALSNQIETTVLMTLGNFKTAITKNDSEVATKLLADDALIVEGSVAETKEEYSFRQFSNCTRCLGVGK